MANEFSRSRSPVRAISTAIHPAWTNVAPRPRTWSEPQISELNTTPLVGTPSPEPLQLACPDCGCSLKLALVADQASQEHHPSSESPTLRPAPEPSATPSFEDSIRDHKRDLIVRALEEHNGVMTRAAKALDLKYTTFVAMVHRLEIDTGAADEC